jgi:hypothetical protein
MHKIRVFIKEPGKKLRSTHVSNTLENLQKIVGGYIETVTFATNLVIICNEEGKITGLPYNCNICGMNFVGTIIFAGVDGDEFGDVPTKYQDMKQLFPQLFE